MVRGQPSLDARTAENRVHIDVTSDDLNALLAHGAHLLRPSGHDIVRHVRADPDTDEFCAFTP